MNIQMTIHALRGSEKLRQQLRFASEFLAVIATLLTLYVCAFVPLDAESNVTARTLLSFAASFFMLSKLVALFPKQ